MNGRTKRKIGTAMTEEGGRERRNIGDIRLTRGRGGGRHEKEGW